MDMVELMITKEIERYNEEIHSLLSALSKHIPYTIESMDNGNITITKDKA